MKKIERFDKHNLDVLSEVATEALNKALNEYGVRVKFGGGRFDSSQADQKFVFMVMDEAGKRTFDSKFLEMVDYKVAAFDLTYSGAHFVGSKYYSKTGDVYEITDFKMSSRKYPVIYNINGHGSYKATINYFRTFATSPTAKAPSKMVKTKKVKAAIPTLPNIMDVNLWFNTREPDLLNKVEGERFDKVEEYLLYDEDEQSVNKLITAVNLHNNVGLTVLWADMLKYYELLKEYKYAEITTDLEKHIKDKK